MSIHGMLTGHWGRWCMCN